MSAERRFTDVQILVALASSRSAKQAAEKLTMSLGAMRKRCKRGPLKRELRAAVRRGLRFAAGKLQWPDSYMAPGVYPPGLIERAHRELFG